MYIVHSMYNVHNIHCTIYYSGCMFNGKVCDGHGTCSCGKCICEESNYEGMYFKEREKRGRERREWETVGREGEMRFENVRVVVNKWKA